MNQQTTQQIWADLAAQPREDISALFAADRDRFAHFSASLGDLLLDFSKTSISRDILQQLLQLAAAAGVAQQRDAMFAGEKINSSENRAVLHTALRADAGRRVPVDGQDVMPEVLRARADMLAFAEHCRSGEKPGVGAGGAYTDVVNIGIGGSDLGGAMAVAALAPRGARPLHAPDGSPLRLHFVSNIDGAHWADAAAGLDPKHTLVIVSSKTFTTAETLANARAARRWLTGALGSDSAAAAQMVAVTAAPERAQEFGIRRVFSYADWVGGRYSLWGAVGLPLALAIGARQFEEFLAGAREMDAHFCEAPAAQNLPLLLALVGVWHRNCCGYPTRALLPYDQRLSLLPPYIQQLDMESNGKRVLQNGDIAPHATAPVAWGSVGTNAQHAYFQMLHQGSDIVPCEFLIAARPNAADDEQHKQLVANCLAQSAALMQGETGGAEVYRHCPGNRPSITIMYRLLTPNTLGRLIALFEHRAFAEGVLWGINSFDQWGVELGKRMAGRLLPMLEGGAGGEDAAAQDASTQGLLSHYNRMQGE